MFVYEPENVRSVLVLLGKRHVFLPGFLDVGPLAERLTRSLPSKGHFRLSGSHVALPSQATFLCDLRPDAVWLTVPPELRPGHDG